MFAFRTRAGGTLEKLSLPGYSADAMVMSNRGDVVVQFRLLTGYRNQLVLYRDSVRAEKLLAEHPYATVTGLNDTGVMVGTDFLPGDPASPYAPYVRFPNGRVDALNDLVDPQTGWVLNVPLDSNNAGQIVGGGTLNGAPRAFRLTPLHRGDMGPSGALEVRDGGEAIQIGGAPFPALLKSAGETTKQKRTKSLQ